MSEVEWRPIPGWEGYYEVSDHGQVRGVDRRTSRGRLILGKMMVPKLVGWGYHLVGLNRYNHQKCVTVHSLVALAFIGPRPEGQVIRHLDGNPVNNVVTNLAYGTHQENAMDTLRHGTHPCASKTHCIHGHAFDAANTYHGPNGSRTCRRCQDARRRKYRAKKASK